MTILNNADTIRQLETSARPGFFGQFVKVRSRIVLGLNGEFNRGSYTIVFENGIHRELDADLKTWKGLDNADAGVICVDLENRAIAVFSRDSELKIPTDIGVRNRTADLLRERFRGFAVHVGQSDGLKPLSEAQQAIGRSLSERK